MVSALLFAAPCARADVLLAVEGELVSKPYVAMTLQVLRSFGVEVIEEELRRFVIPAPQQYQPAEYAVEPDASGASYFLAAPLIAGGQVTIEGLGQRSVQGDVRFADVLAEMGASVVWEDHRVSVAAPPAGQRLRGIGVDLGDMPDTAQTLGVVALFAEGPTTIRNIANLRIKETDRLAALARELTRLGATVKEHDDWLAINPPPNVLSGPIDTYDDHRMAMSFALAGLARKGIVIRDCECVSKTFPDFFELFEAMCAERA
jgi:3-phosphoshikimate 1-carboxyvinyltransferase